jgi:hypothetical protein
MSDKKPIVALLVLLIALLAACQPAGAEPGAAEPTVAATADAPTTDPAAAIIAAARAHLAAELGFADSEIAVVSAEPAEFSDACLGLGGPAESCLQVMTPGWLVLLDAAGQTYELHTDTTGAQVRLAAEGSGEPSDPDAATAAAVAALATELGVAEDEIEVVSLEGADYTDSCLGLGGPEESCLQVITLGWLIQLAAGGQTYEAHTDGTGQQVRIAGLDGGGPAGAVDAITASAVAVLADRLGVAPDAITVVSAEETEFSDGCLGLGGPEESCLQAITPGWLVVLSADGQEYEAHTDETGVQVRIAE